MESAAVPDQAPAPVTSSPSRRRLWLERLLVALWLLALFAGCEYLYTRHNGFPIEYHPDEPGRWSKCSPNAAIGTSATRS